MTSETGATVTADDTIRLGLGSLKGVKEKPILQMLAERRARPFSSLADFLCRTNFNLAERRTLARAGALNAFAGDRRSALWKVEAVHEEDDLFRFAAVAPNELSPLDQMTHLERLQSDYATLVYLVTNLMVRNRQSIAGAAADSLSKVEPSC